MTIPKSSFLLKKYKIKAEKKFGQNFILDSNLTDKIVKSTEIDLSKFEVLEIGPGGSTLTQSILRANPIKLTVIEKDPRFLPLLQEVSDFYNKKLQIIQDDALKIDEKQIIKKKPYIIIANLPYNIGTELLFKWALYHASDIKTIVVLLQKEVVERIVAKPNSKKYGRLSILLNFLCETKHLFNIPPTAFAPAPKVQSSVVKITPKNINIDPEKISNLEKTTHAAFSMRRKKIKTSLKSIADNIEEILKKLNIDPNLRAENLTIEKFYHIAKNI